MDHAQRSSMTNIRRRHNVPESGEGQERHRAPSQQQHRRDSTEAAPSKLLGRVTDTYRFHTAVPVLVDCAWLSLPPCTVLDHATRLGRITPHAKRTLPFARSSFLRTSRLRKLRAQLGSPLRGSSTRLLDLEDRRLCVRRRQTRPLHLVHPRRPSFAAGRFRWRSIHASLCERRAA